MDWTLAAVACGSALKQQFETGQLKLDGLP
jgi:hypothetical protein